MQVSFVDTDTLHLVERLKTGDQLAAKKLYDQYGKAMYNTLIRMTNNLEEAEDLLQEAFIRAFHKIDQFGGTATFGAWLKKIVINTGLEALRKKRIRFEELDEETERMIPADSDQVDWREVMDDIDRVHECISSLPDGSRNVVCLYLLEGLTHDEIGEVLGISKSTSKTQYMRGKALLKQKMIDLYGTRSI